MENIINFFLHPSTTTTIISLCFSAFLLFVVFPLVNRAVKAKKIKENERINNNDRQDVK